MMQLRGKVFKVGKYWAIECPTLNAHTQGTSRKDALEMMVDWVRTMLDDESFQVDIRLDGKNEFVMSFENVKAILALAFRQLRASNAIPVRECVARMKGKSPNEVQQYLTGEHAPGFEKAMQLADVFDCDLELAFVPRANVKQTTSTKKLA